MEADAAVTASGRKGKAERVKPKRIRKTKAESSDEETEDNEAVSGSDAAVTAAATDSAEVEPTGQPSCLPGVSSTAGAGPTDGASSAQPEPGSDGDNDEDQGSDGAAPDSKSAEAAERMDHLVMETFMHALKTR